VIRTARRDELQAYLKERGIGAEVYYPVPMHLQECFSYLGYKVGSFPESERAARETLAIPIQPELTEDRLRYVVDCVRDFIVNKTGHCDVEQTRELQAVPAL
jgi:dTDP-4-amino-4,6-dideoxygalactose transaminase